MQYKINEFANLASISTRTLRYYDQIGLLKPSSINDAGYRYYGPYEVDRLEQIMYLKALDVPLKTIKKILNAQPLNHLELLNDHLVKLNQKKNHIESIIKMLKQSIEAKERNIVMNDKDKFTEFKNTLINENESQYKDEVESKWGKDAYAQSKKAFSNMSEKDYNHFKALETQILIQLKNAYDQKLALDSKEVIQIVKLHQEWITLAWGSYNKDAHFQLVDMYVDDHRFKAYYDKEQDGLAILLRDAVQHHLAK